MANKGLGRVPSPPDDRDRAFSMETFDPNLMFGDINDLPSYRYWTRGNILDQGNTPHCVGFSFAQWIQTSPTRSTQGNARGHEIYDKCKLIDNYSGDGTYIRAGAKVMQNEGRVENYVWAYHVDTVIRWILQRGPVVVGTIWTEDMFDPDYIGGKPRLKPTGNEVGGHAYILNGYNQNSRLFRMVNSWGANWADNGRAFIHFDDFQELINRGAEMIGAVERRP